MESLMTIWFSHRQMIPSDIKFDGNATPPQFTDNGSQVIEKGTHIRVKIKGIRGEVGQMYAIATIKEVRPSTSIFKLCVY